MAEKVLMKGNEAIAEAAIQAGCRHYFGYPITPQTERLCYEFRGTCGGEEYIVYISVETGEEEQIFRIINTEDGELVM